MLLSYRALGVSKLLSFLLAKRENYSDLCAHSQKRSASSPELIAIRSSPRLSSTKKITARPDLFVGLQRSEICNEDFHCGSILATERQKYHFSIRKAKSFQFSEGFFRGFNDNYQKDLRGLILFFNCGCTELFHPHTLKNTALILL